MTKYTAKAVMFMSLRSIKGLVASERDYGENDRFISVITEEHGVIDISVKGAKKITGKNNSSSQLFSYSKFCINERGGRRYLNSSEPIHIFYGLRLDLKKLSLACYIAEAAAYSLTPEKNERDLLRLILNSLYLLENGERNADFIKAVFELRFTADMGHMPLLMGCKECFKHESDEMFFSARRGILLCGEHFEQANSAAYFDFKLTAGLLHAMRHICLSPIEKAFGFKISDNTQKALSDISEKYLLTHLSPDYMFKTLEYYKKIPPVQ
ncbi:MAG: DNA repair protein RecO [Oscillospiraceae bacterium]|nr:DNA repair protein RecO [Oscillospiraceae bacterium]